jgi:hypothetical protein
MTDIDKLADSAAKCKADEASTSTPSANPFNPAALRLKQDYNGPAGVKKLLTRVPIRRPGKQDWYRTHPDPSYRMDMGVICYEEDDGTYAVIQDLQPELVDLMVPVTIYTVITRQRDVLLWPVRLPGADGKNHDAWTSSHEAAERATKKWTRMQWSPSLGSYEMYEATGILTDPEWPDVSFHELLRIGFQGKIIDKPDHLVIKRLRGEL